MERLKDISDLSRLTRALEELYPNERFGSRASLYSVALDNEVITREVYNSAKEYYGKLWNYCGD